MGSLLSVYRFGIQLLDYPPPTTAFPEQHMTTDFQLHPQLRKDCLEVGHFKLSQILLMNDSQYPWLILVPRRADIREIYQLNTEDREQLMRESCWLAQAMAELYLPDKLNIAAIGNLVPQLHLHHVARYQTDIAWPAPIWGKFAAVAYREQAEQTRIADLRRCLQENFA